MCHLTHDASNYRNTLIVVLHCHKNRNRMTMKLQGTTLSLLTQIYRTVTVI